MGKFTAMQLTHTSPEDPLMPIRDAAGLLGVSVKTLRRWESAGKITAVRTPGGQRRFRQSDVDALLKVDQ